MKILMVAGFPCIRALKESQALKRRGHSIVLLCVQRSNNTDWDWVADQIYVYTTPAEFHSMLKSLAKECDIVHAHNEPNWHVALAAHLINDRPVVYDCHDFTSMRSDISHSELMQEKFSFECSDAVIHVSEELCRQADLRYKQKKTLVLHSLPSLEKDKLKLHSKSRDNSVAYQGGLQFDSASSFDYRNYLEYFSYLASQKITVHIFPAQTTSQQCRAIYASTKYSKYIRVHDTQEYKDLLSNLSKSTWGFTGFYRRSGETESKALYLDNAMPNKLFEYLFVGLTPIVINCVAASNFVTKHNVGYHVNSMEEFADIVKNAPPLAHNMDMSLLDMNIQIEKLEKLYYDLLG